MEALLRTCKCAVCVSDFVEPVVDEIECEGEDGDEGNAICPLSRSFRIGWVSARMEGKEGNDEDNLIVELTPSLHEEGELDVATTMQFVTRRGVLTASATLHRACRRHRVFATDTDTCERVMIRWLLT